MVKYGNRAKLLALAGACVLVAFFFLFRIHDEVPAGIAAADGILSALHEEGPSEGPTKGQMTDLTAHPELEEVQTKGEGEYPLTRINPFNHVQPRSPEAAVEKLKAEAELNFTCPPFRYPKGKSADSQTVQEAMYKYSRYTQQYCNTTGMLQMQMQLSTYLMIMDKIAELTKVKANDRLFDWGSGCGTMLNYFHLKYNSTGIGIDVTDDAVKHAMSHRQPNQLFCLLNGVDLRAFEDNSFDAVVTWATVYHVRRTMQQCEIVTNLVRMLKPGGRAYIGHLRTEKTQEYWKKKKCRIPGATIARIRDWKTFKQKSWKRHDFFSLLIYKDATVTNVTTIPPTQEGEAYD